MLRIGIVGCGLQAATIAGHLGIYGDAYEVVAVMDTDFVHAKAMIARKEVVLAKDCRFFASLDEFVANAAGLDGIVIGTPCAFHTEVACKLEKLRVPIHLEKPVAITLEQFHQLYATFKDSPTSVQVSLPMRICPLATEAKRIIESGAIGTVEQVVGHEDVAGGDGYFSSWYRDFAKTGGMFLQKAVHDLDYMFHLAGSRPKQICAMSAQRVFGGDKPFDLRCVDCADQQDCPESPYNRFHERGWGKTVHEPSGHCRFSKGIKIDDIGECLVELESGAQLCHTQNFFLHNDSSRRGAHFYGYKGTLVIDYNNHSLKVMSHRRRKTELIDMPYGAFNHYGGDKELVFEFLKTMKTGERSLTDLVHREGFDSTLACLLARESAKERKFMDAEL